MSDPLEVPKRTFSFRSVIIIRKIWLPLEIHLVGLEEQLVSSSGVEIDDYCCLEGTISCRWTLDLVELLWTRKAGNATAC